MSQEQLKAFGEAIEANATLQERVSSAADLDAVVAIAKESGFLLSQPEVETLNTLILSHDDGEDLSDEDLAQVAGGINWGSFGRVFSAIGRGAVRSAPAMREGAGAVFNVLDTLKDKIK